VANRVEHGVPVCRNSVAATSDFQAAQRAPGHSMEISMSLKRIQNARSLLITAVALIALACGRGDNVTVPPPGDGAASGATAPVAERSMATSDMAVSRQAQAPAPPTQPPQPGQGGGAVTMIIRTGNASIEVDSLEPAIAAVNRMATSLGGIVGNTSLSSGEYEVRSATIELRIPSTRFNEALEGLKPIGKVESVQSNAQDVSEEFVDVTARVANAKRLEERLIALLANRTGKLEEVLAVERELARIREEIERYEGRIRFLQTRVATSTLTITVHEAKPLVNTSPGENVIVEAFKTAWRNFVSFVAGFIAMLGVLIPLAILIAPLVIGYMRYERRRRAPKTPEV
jgi:hypothetical protein